MRLQLAQACVFHRTFAIHARSPLSPFFFALAKDQNPQRSAPTPSCCTAHCPSLSARFSDPLAGASSSSAANAAASPSLASTCQWYRACGCSQRRYTRGLPHFNLGRVISRPDAHLNHCSERSAAMCRRRSIQRKTFAAVGRSYRKIASLAYLTAE